MYIDSYNAHVTGFACEARYIFMKNEMIETKNQVTPDKELSVFEGKKSDEKRMQKIADKAKTEKLKKQRTQAKIEDELVKFNIVEQVFNELIEAYDFISIQEKLYVYVKKSGYWKLITDSESQREIRKRVERKWRGRINKNNLQEIYEWLILDAKQLDPSVFREGRHYLNFCDVAYNWNKNEVTKDRKKLYFRYSLQVPFDLKGGNGKFKDFVNDIFGADTKSIEQFQKFIGLALSDMRTFKYAFILYGPSNSGKSVLMNVLRFLVGAEATASVSFSQMSSEFHTAQLNGRRLNLSAEVSGVTLSRLDVFRALCGNDEVLVSNKMKDPFSFVNRCLLIFACNCLPKISDPMEAQSVVERLIIFPFKNAKPREEWDTKLTEKLYEDYPNIIKFAIEGLRLFEESNHTIEESPAMRQCKMQYAAQYDSFSMFAQKYIVSSQEERVSSASIKRAYHQYCLLNDCVELNDNVWGQIIKRNFVCVSTTLSDREHRVRGYKGVTLSPKAEELFKKEAPESTELKIYGTNM